MRYLIDLGKKLFPICRSITGKGTLKTLKIIKKEIKGLKIKRIKSDSKVFDWKIPKEWNVTEAYVIDKNNKRIIDFKNNNLHLVGYSFPVNTIMEKNEFLKKLHYINKNSDAIPYVTSYYNKYWGFCVNEKQFNNLKKNYNKQDKFKIFINSQFNKYGFLNYGELLLPGKSKDEILITTYVCHPSMANNELSGPLLSIALAKFYSTKKLNRSLRFIFIPETIGSIAYIKKNYKQLNKILFGLNLTCVGDNKKYSFLQSKYADTYLDKICLDVYKKLNIKFKKYSFLSRGSDERQFSSPNINIPMVSLMRSKYGTYPEYHTSLDNFKFVNAEGIKNSFKIHKIIIDKLITEKKENFYFGRIKKNRNIRRKKPYCLIKCEPNMGKRGLYHLISKKSIKEETKNLMNFIQYADGSNSLEEIRKLIKIPTVTARKIYNILKKEKIVK
jgi:aminopeptidase-like protein